MGLQTTGFPNLFFENGALFCNFTRCAEATAEFVSGCIGYMRDKGFERIEPSPAAEAESRPDQWKPCKHPRHWRPERG